MLKIFFPCGYRRNVSDCKPPIGLWTRRHWVGGLHGIWQMLINSVSSTTASTSKLCHISWNGCVALWWMQTNGTGLCRLRLPTLILPSIPRLVELIHFLLLDKTNWRLFTALFCFFSIALDIDTGKISLYYYCVCVCVLMRCFSSRITCTFVDSLSALFETVFPCHDWCLMRMWELQRILLADRSGEIHPQDL